MIRLRNICMEMDGRMILDDVSLEVPTGHTKVVLGPSGAGKSSLLKIILGLWKPDSGSVFVDALDITRLSERQQMPVRRRMSMVFQGNALFDSLTVEENVGFFLEEHSDLPPAEIRERVNDCLEFVNLPGTNDLLPEELSGGMKKRVAIARAIAFNPEAILYDEPTTGLDPINAKTVTELVMKLREERGVTSVVVTHILRDAFAVGDSLALMDGGRIVSDGPPPALLASKDPFIVDFLSEIHAEARLVANLKRTAHE
ncbi:MAG TPA: ATP-binding cassette domain-containing protein [Bacteroidota bacterium]|nr:ATP-binding cassette domain-containing protein [Bacteroidota bacterium]